MINLYNMKKILIILGFLLVPYSIKACLCDYKTNEFCFRCYEEADIVAIIEVQSFMSDDYLSKLLKENPKDSVFFYRMKSLTSKDYNVTVVETFKGNTNYLTELSGGYGSTCDGRTLQDGQKYLFYLNAADSIASKLSYSLCTRNELILDSFSNYIKSIKIDDYWEFIELKECAKNYHIDSLVQSNKIDILRRLRDKSDGEIVAYYSGYYSKEKVFFKRDNLLNFKGYFHDGERHGEWEFYSVVSELDSLYKDKRAPYHLISKGHYNKGKKTGEWLYYRWDPSHEKLIERKEYF